MRLFLPHQAWYVRLTKSFDQFEAIVQEWEKARVNLNLIEEPDTDAVLCGTYDPAKLLGRAEVKWVKEVWYWCTEDPVALPEDPMGEEIEVCMGTSIIYDDYERAVIDLARAHPPAARLVYLAMYGPEIARPIARAILDGDRAALGPLADALEEAGHADAKEVRKLAKAEPKKAEPQGGRGKRLADVPAPAPKPAAKAPSKSKPAATPRAPAEAAELKPAASGQQEVVVVGGYPCAGKSTYVQTLIDAKYQRLNRDQAGGTLEELHRQVRPLYDRGRSIVLDNLYATAASRASLLKAVGPGVPVRFVLLDTSIEDAAFNACLRMMEKYGRVLHPEDLKKAPYKGDPSAYPVAVLYKYRNDFEPPAKAEGFASVETVAFVRRYPPEWKNKAVIFDFDGTLRTHEGREKYPLRPAEVRAMKDRAGKLRELQKQGYLLLGASNQSGVAKGTLTAADAEACFAETAKQLGVTFAEIKFCPHKVPPISCYCRKPGPGMGVELIVKHKLDPKLCVFVGDQTTDRSFAQKCGFEYADQATYFAR